MNPYEESREVLKTAAVEIESSRAIAEVQGQVVMAKKFPRDPVVAMDRILQECRRQSLAEQSQYSYPRGGQVVEGPSIRMAETLARNWGNISYGTVEVDRVGDESSMLAYAWDLETNAMARQEFKVRHLRDTKEGRKAVRDERDVYEITANMGSRRLRACILRIIPGDVTEEAMAECNATLRDSIGDVTERLPRLLEAFKDLGVSKAQIENRIRHRVESLNGPEYLALRKVFQSLKDGFASVSDYFEPERVEEPKKQSIAEAARKAATRATANAQASSSADIVDPPPPYGQATTPETGMTDFEKDLEKARRGPKNNVLHIGKEFPAGKQSAENPASGGMEIF